VKQHVYLTVRPDLVIDGTGGASLGNCYGASYFRITSRRRLSQEQIKALFALGLLGSGQEFYVRSQCDGKEEAGAVDEVGCTKLDETGKPTGEPPINPYNGQPRTGTVRYEYFVYDTETRCDSGD
jgi:hypothetical protein